MDDRIVKMDLVIRMVSVRDDRASKLLYDFLSPVCLSLDIPDRKINSCLSKEEANSLSLDIGTHSYARTLRSRTHRIF